MNRTRIQYLDYTWNITHGCTPDFECYQRCWAKAMSKRLAGMGMRGYDPADPFKVTFCPWKLDEPLKVKKPSRIGVSFMGDLFHENVSDQQIDQVFSVMAEDICYPLHGLNKKPHHTYLILTKRPERILQGHPEHFARWPNIWLGVSAENQQRLDERWQYLKDISAAVSWISYEPALGPLVLPQDFLDRGNRAWLVCGAETGPGARPMDPEWARDVLRQCREAGVPFFFKGLGEWRVDDFSTVLPSGATPQRCWLHKDGEAYDYQYPYNTTQMMRVGKKAPIPSDLMVREYPNA